jgi:hypothetical protein
MAKGFGGKKHFSVTLSSSGPLDAIQEVVFFDAAGKKLESKSAGRSRMTMAGKTTYAKSFQLKKTEKVNLRFSYYTKLETIEVPIDVTTGVGL